MNINNYIISFFNKYRYYIKFFILLFNIIKILNNSFDFDFLNEDSNNSEEKNKDKTVVNEDDEKKKIEKYLNLSNISYSIRFLLYLWIGIKIWGENLDPNSIPNIVFLIEFIDTLLIDLANSEIEKNTKEESEKK